MQEHKILLLGAGNSQVDAINYCKAHGYTVIGCSYTTKDSGIPLLDHFKQVDIKNIEGVSELAQEYDVDAVYSVGSDLAVPTCAKVSELLGLPHFISYNTAVLCHSKHKMREALGNDFKGNVSFVVCSAMEQALEYDDFPAMMKPVDSQGQRGCFRVDSKADIEEHFASSIDYSLEGKVIIESYIEGNEISVNSYRKDGKTVFAIVSDRVVFTEYPGGLVKKHRLPSRYADAETQAEAIDLVDRIADRLGITDGPCYCQLKLGRDGRPYVLEITPRLDGCHMWHLIKEYCKVDLLDMSFRHLLHGEDVSAVHPEPSDATYELEFLCEKTGMSFDPDKYDMDGIEASRLYYGRGDRVYKVNGYFEKCGYVIRKTDQ